ncbi:MAG TPA: FHA domain-containing protein [Myxococcota bacterium]|nr:FHA domain-containing protein [Myxococcota bacterium]
MGKDTIIMKAASAPMEIRVAFDAPDGGRRTLTFSEPFRVGREDDCQILLADEVVSKRHLEVYRDNEGWWVRDLGSMNGTFLNGERVQHALITRDSEIQIAPDGPILLVELVRQEDATAVQTSVPAADGGQLEEHRPETVPDLSSEPQEEQAQGSVTQLLEKYTADEPDHDAGPHTLLMRRAFKRVKRTEKARYRVIVAAACLLLAIAVVIAVYQHVRLAKLTEMGVGIFYNMKTLEIQVERLLEKAARSGDTAQLETLAEERKQLEQMRQRYSSYVDETGILSVYSDPEDRLIFKVARLFGECELNMPRKFTEEVKDYIEKWKSTSRLREAVRRIDENGYAADVFKIMVDANLPPQFLYVALQESDFKPRALGPKTRFGIAKGFWQMIPTTAAQFGLKTGPLVELRRYDPRDERFDFNKATIAASKYLRYIYNTEAQASGLLVIASYNWGQNNIRRLLRKMPENPRARNFWKLLAGNKIPRETYDYVLYIVSAAVIGENPALFGFDFDHPLRGLE